MSDAPLYRPGTVCWLDLGTTDGDAAAAFYQRLFGWQAARDAATGYTNLGHDGRPVAGMYELMPEQRDAGVRPFWLPYFATADVHASVAQAAALGATPLGEVFEPRTEDGTLFGRGAALVDPTGAPFGLWEGHTHRGFGVGSDAGVPGRLCWAELATRDAGAATAFYGALFGYTAERAPMEGMDYTLLQLDGEGVGGLYEMDESYGDAPSHWMPYLAVEDADATADDAGAAGGSVCVPPTDIPTVGRFAIIDDPQGATFSILRPVPIPA